MKADFYTLSGRRGGKEMRGRMLYETSSGRFSLHLNLGGASTGNNIARGRAIFDSITRLLSIHKFKSDYRPPKKGRQIKGFHNNQLIEKRRESSYNKVLKNILEDAEQKTSEKYLSQI